jgi:hypothetical protein
VAEIVFFGFYMHGLVNRAVHCFLYDVYGAQMCRIVLAQSGCEPDTEFDVLRHYDDALTAKLIQTASRELKQPEPDFLEDLGVYLASHPNCINIRRILRFGGDSFQEFLHSLTELRERVRLAVDDLELPEIELRQHDTGRLSLSVLGENAGMGYVLTGVLRAMADDYGALALFESVGRYGRAETISVQLLDVHYAGGREFELLNDIAGI